MRLYWAALVFAFVVCLVQCCRAQAVKLRPVEDKELSAILQDPATFWYDDRNMPPAMQGNVTNGSEPHVFSRAYNISADPREPAGTPNREFPWLHTAGIDGTNAQTVKFLHLPPGKKVALYRERVAKLSPPGYINRWAWIFPVDTVVGELLLLPEAGQLYPFEIRIRKRERDDWAVDIFRPKNIAQHATGERVEVRSKATPAFRKELSGIAQKIEGGSLVDAVFVSALGTDEHYTSDRDGLVPAGYFGAIAGTDRESCRNCHNDVGKNADVLQPRRDWYQLTRGADGIFSWHPFAHSSISPNGANLPLRFNRDIADQFELYDAAHHSADSYTRLIKFAPHRHGSDDRSSRLQNAVTAKRAGTVPPHNHPHEHDIDYQKIVDLLVARIKVDVELQLLLKGEDGADGEDGAPGPEGPAGEPGEVDVPELIEKLPPITIQLFDNQNGFIGESSKRLGETFRLKLERSR